MAVSNLHFAPKMPESLLHARKKSIPQFWRIRFQEMQTVSVMFFFSANSVHFGWEWDKREFVDHLAKPALFWMGKTLFLSLANIIVSGDLHAWQLPPSTDNFFLSFFLPLVLTEDFAILPTQNPKLVQVRNVDLRILSLKTCEMSSRDVFHFRGILLFYISRSVRGTEWIGERIGRRW